MAKEVSFYKYCETCKYEKLSEKDDPCRKCLKKSDKSCSHIPINWKEKERRFIAILTDDTQYCFNNECNNVDYNHNIMCVFKNIINKDSYVCLAVIPHERIKAIISIDICE